MEFKTEYYLDPMALMLKYEIPPEAASFAGDAVMVEEMMFSFNLFLVV